MLLATVLAGCGGGGGDGGPPQSMNLSASASSPSEVGLSWTADPHTALVGYDLYRNGEAAWSTHLSGTRFTDRGLAAGTRYCYRVYAMDFLLGAVGRSNEACVTTPAYASGWALGNIVQGDAADFVLGPSDGQHVALRRSDGLHLASNLGGGWSEQLVDGNAGAWGLPSLALDGAGVVHVGYGKLDTGGVFHASNAGGAWSVETVDANGAVAAALALDAAGKLHMVYDQVNPAFFTHSLMYATNASGSWQTRFLSGYGYPIQSAAIALDSGGAVHMAYAVGSGLCVVGHVKYAAGVGTQTVVDTDAGCAVSLALDGSDTPHVAYRKSLQVRHASLGAGAWSPEVVETLSWIGSDAVSLAVDAGNRLHLSYGDQNGDLKYASRLGGSWAFSYVDRGAGRSILRLGQDGRVHIVYGPDSTGMLRLARSP